jgi:hypothetical protein
MTHRDDMIATLKREMREVLEPFARLADCLPFGAKDTMPLILMGHALDDTLPPHIMAGDLRRAKEAYDELED